MNRHRLISLPLVALLFMAPAVAEDIDLFMGVARTGDDRPSLLFVIDNAANFESSASGYTRCSVRNPSGGPAILKNWQLDGTVGGIEQCALYNVIDALPPDSVNIGVMVYNDSGIRDFQGNVCRGAISGVRTGGCLVYPITPMTVDNKAEMLGWIERWRTTGASQVGSIKSNNQSTGAAMQEAWAYYRGRRGLSEADYSGIKPTQSACGKSYVVFIGNSYSSSGQPGDQSNEKGPRHPLLGLHSVPMMNASPAATAGEKVLITGTMNTACGAHTIVSGDVQHESSGFFADEWSRYMKGGEITTYTIGVLGSACQASYASLLASMADVGGGKYFPTSDYGQLVLALGAILSEIQAVNSAFASVSLPVSVNTQGTFLNQVFVGMFRPDPNALPRWMGNVKQYRLGRFGNELRLFDAKPATSPESASGLALSSAGTGFVAECARSFWTPVAHDDYWRNLTDHQCLSVPPFPASSNTPDGNIVEKGAAGFVLRGSRTATSFTRTVRTCVTCADNSTPALFEAANTGITKTMLGDALMTDAQRTALIRWARGENNRGDENYVAATALRPSAHGDVVHSRPAAINFGSSDADRRVVVFYGGNDGVLRAINGNRTEAIGNGSNAVAAGAELWAFMPQEFFPQIKRLRDNTTQVSFVGMPDLAGVTRLPKPYGMDGPMTVYQPDRSTTWLYLTMRRGGRTVYAFDASNVASATNPGQVTLKWRRGCPSLVDDAGCSPGWEQIGQTWTAPVVVKAGGHSQPLLVMGGGYDRCEDGDPHTCVAGFKGNRIYVVDGNNGAVFQEFATSRPVAADVSIVTDFNTGEIQYAYAVDTGGSLYRISGATASAPIGTTPAGSWTITTVARLGCQGAVSTSCQRKFLFAPDVVVQGGVHHVLVGSGDREKPVRAYTAATQVQNYFFMVKDAPFIPDWLSGESGRCGSDVICLASLVQVPDSGNPDAAALAESKGWYLGMRAQEQVVTSAITVFGNTTFSSHTPSAPDPNSCSANLGTTRVYNISFLNAAPKAGANNRDAQVAGGGLPPSPVAGRVILDGETTPTPFLIGGSATSALEALLPPTVMPATQPKGWLYWYIER